MLRNPSEVAVPEFVQGWCRPVATVGIAIDCTRTPPGVYSSRKVAVEALVSAPEPVPTRTTTRLPNVRGTCAVLVTTIRQASRGPSVDGVFMGVLRWRSGIRPGGERGVDHARAPMVQCEEKRCPGAATHRRPSGCLEVSVP